uniref:Kinesin motor domain-containing protein n=1 Tax=Glossina brevipalpis TaxID=37001 RepID=A0A1A9W2V3_9MUSC
MKCRNKMMNAKSMKKRFYIEILKNTVAFKFFEIVEHHNHSCILFTMASSLDLNYLMVNCEVNSNGLILIWLGKRTTSFVQENLGEKSKTVMLTTISSAKRHIDETLATLRYACQAVEIDRLKLLQNEYQPKENTETPDKVVNSANEKCANEIENLREQLIERKKELCRFQKPWIERLADAENLRISKLQLLQKLLFFTNQPTQLT